MELVWSTILIVFNLVAFASVHSLIASLSFKRLIVRVVGSRADILYLPAYSLIAMLTISPLVYLLYKYPGRLLYRIPSPWRWLMICGQLIASIAAPKAFMDGSNRFMIRSQLSRSKAPGPSSLNIRGIYRCIRDPFLLSGLLMICHTHNDRKSPRDIHFDFHIHVYGVPALGKQTGSTIWQRIQ